MMVVFDHELLLQALHKEQMIMERVATCKLEMLPGLQGSAFLSCPSERC